MKKIILFIFFFNIITVQSAECLRLNEEGDYTTWKGFMLGGSLGGISPSLSPDNKTLYFMSPKTGHGDIYSFNLETGEYKRLTDNRAYEAFPVVSPDGKTVAYVCERSRKKQIHIMHSDGKENKDITKEDFSCFDLSFLTSREIVFMQFVYDPKVNASIPQVYIGDNLQCNYTQITNDGYSKSGPQLSIDGENIYYWQQGVDNDRRRITKILLVNTKSKTPLVKGIVMGDAYEVNFSLLIGRIVYIKAVDGKYNYQVYTSNIDGTDEKQLTTIKGHKSACRFSYDGKYITFLLEDGKGGGTVYIMDSDGNNMHPICKIIGGRIEGGIIAKKVTE